MNFTKDPEIIARVPHVDVCACQVGLPFEFTMAFQPIWDWRAQKVFAYEALVRGKDGCGAGAILSQVTAKNKYAFDQACRVTAIRLAAELAMPKDCFLSINFLPNAIYDPNTCIRATLEAAEQYQFPYKQIMFEMTEQEGLSDNSHLTNIVEAYQKLGFITAIDDFGQGYSGLHLLSQFQPDVLKIDMDLVQGIATDPVKHAIVEGIVLMCNRLNIQLIAEGIETVDDMKTLMDLGIPYLQGYLLARPEIETLPEIQVRN
ncbi:EAL domain-containing protein [Salinispirillum marinum]|uniref:EAL domain-containing protein n=2 Tax=Saccharospirillaceae TaxID=255527 RepID=A0ABV8BEV3_9GAMM